MNFDSSSRDNNPTSAVKFLTSVGNLMTKENATIRGSANMRDFSGDNITDTPNEGKSNKYNIIIIIIIIYLWPYLKQRSIKQTHRKKTSDNTLNYCRKHFRRSMKRVNSNMYRVG